MRIAIEAQRIYRKEKHGMDYVALEMIKEKLFTSETEYKDEESNLIKKGK